MDELKAVDEDLDQVEHSARILNNAKRVIRRYTDAVFRFPELDSITNRDLLRVLYRISFIGMAMFGLF